jgi:hypothetical protein
VNCVAVKEPSFLTLPVKDEVEPSCPVNVPDNMEPDCVTETVYTSGGQLVPSVRVSERQTPLRFGAPESGGGSFHPPPPPPPPCMQPADMTSSHAVADRKR